MSDGRTEGLDRECSVFCYPFGEFDRSAERAVRAAGYRGAFCSLQGSLHAPHSRYRMARLTAASHAGEPFVAQIHTGRSGRAIEAPVAASARCRVDAS